MSSGTIAQYNMMGIFSIQSFEKPHNFLLQIWLYVIQHPLKLKYADSRCCFYETLDYKKNIDSARKLLKVAPTQ